jgi:hypothetical protein
MKLTDIPPHITDLRPPWFPHKFHEKYKISCDYDDVEPYFHLNYYDGPLSGIARCKDKYFYCQAIYDEDRHFWASWELTEEELKNVLARYEEFCKWVGDHTTYKQDEEGNWFREMGTKSREGMDNFYKNENLPKIDLAAIQSRDIFGILFNPFRNDWR